MANSHVQGKDRVAGNSSFLGSRMDRQFATGSVCESIAVVVEAVDKWAVLFRPLIHSLLRVSRIGLALHGAQLSL